MDNEIDNEGFIRLAKAILDNEPSERVDERDDINLIGGLTMPVKNTNKLKMENKNHLNFDELIKNVIQWADDKSILKPENASKQMLKVMEEVGETAGALAKNDQVELKDGIGDAFVTLIILAKQCGFTPEGCLEAAWDEIKNRTGKTVNGVFIKN